jgi:hypothetical protein
LRSKWSNISRSCTLENKFQWRYNVTATTVTDIAQLIIMFVGLWRSRREKRGFIHYLYIQVSGMAAFRVPPLWTMTMPKLD